MDYVVKSRQESIQESGVGLEWTRRPLGGGGRS